MSNCAAFQQAATHTWHMLKTCHYLGISVGEDAITTNLLVALSLSVPTTTVVFDTRPIEPFAGCDFELYVGSNATGWRGYAVQAKKLTISNGSYGSLNHSNALGLQIDLLDSYAHYLGIDPIYLFYNTLTPHTTGLCTHAYPLEQIGCTVAPSSVVRTALATYGGRKYSWIHSKPSTMLFRCLVCHAPIQLKNSFPSGNIVHEQLPQRVLQILESGFDHRHSEENQTQLRSRALVVVQTDGVS